MTRIRRLWLDRNGERGDGGTSLELLILTPAVLAVFAIIVAAGRYEIGSAKIDQAAAAAARAASIQVAADTARTAADQAATESLAGSGASCRDVTVEVDTSAFTAPPNTPAAQVQVTVSCTVSWSDLTIPGWPGEKTISSTAASPVDTARAGT